MPCKVCIDAFWGHGASGIGAARASESRADASRTADDTSTRGVLSLLSVLPTDFAASSATSVANLR
ncbi:MAG: hypothetical protein H6925_04375 [Holosporaceae bacterium]|nr:MAG: hypothetical protein H6925_04375 [Holosporaceae bacterium]